MAIKRASYLDAVTEIAHLLPDDISEDDAVRHAVDWIRSGERQALFHRQWDAIGCYVAPNGDIVGHSGFPFA